MTRLFLIIALVLPLLIDSLKLNEDEHDMFNSGDVNSGVRFPIDFKSYSPLDDSVSGKSISYSGVKWSAAALNSEFLEQNYDLKSRKFDLDSSSITNMNILFGTQSNLWITGSSLRKLDLESDLLVDNFKPGSKLFLNKFSPNIVIISDPIGKEINLSKNNGKSFYLKSTPFRPDLVYFTPDEKIILGAEAISQYNNDLWVSLNFGEQWIHLGKCKSAPEWEESKEISSIYYINGDQQLVKLNLKDLNSDQDVSSRAQIVKSDVREFELVDNKFLFVTSLNSDMVLQILNLKNPTEFVTAAFNFDKTPERIIDYNVVWADENEILVAVYYDLNFKIRADLFRSTDFKKFSFGLTLTNLAYNEKKFDLEVRVLNKRGGVILANVHSDENDYRMLKTMSRMTSNSEWKEIKLTPELKQSHLDLSSAKFMFSHEYENSIIEDPKSPDFAISSVLGKNGEKLGVYGSQSDASEWSQLNKGAHASSYTNFGHVLLSADQSRPVDELIFTLNKGVDWHRMKFSDEAVRVNELLTVDPTQPDHLPRFVVIATNSKTGARLVFKIDAVKQQQGNRDNSLPPDVSIEDDEDDDDEDDHDDDCKLKCFNKLAPTQPICLRKEMICNGKTECKDDIDELNCVTGDDSYEYNDKKIKDDILYRSQLPAVQRLTAISTITPFKLNVHYAGFSQSTFTLTYSLDVERKRSASRINRQQVGVYRLREDERKEAATIDDATLQAKGEVMSVFEFDSYEIGSERTIEVENLQPGYIYVCIFFINLDGTRFKTYKLLDRLAFTNSGFIDHVHVKASPTERNIKLALIVAVALLATLSLLLFAIILCRCCLNRRRRSRVIAAGMKYQPIKKQKQNVFFSRSTDNQILPLANNAFIEDGVYNPPNV